MRKTNFLTLRFIKNAISGRVPHDLKLCTDL